ncbi:MAG: FecR family protein [Gammaproteobacteria bacterium]|nr:FecR family protein [Gammaproteobacteria bacterium]
MTMYSKPGKVVGVLLLWAVVAFGAQAATEAGSVSFAFGDATIEGTDGAERTARRGVTLYSGDTISTGPRGRVQMRFTDGGFVSLTPDTSFRIDEYRFEGEADGSEKGFFSLIKGGMRALTGLVGKKNRESYQLSTVVATIGIRGTLYRATFDPVIMKFLASVGVDPTDPDSGLQITAAGKSIVIGPGGSVVVEGEGSPPRPTTEQAQVAAAQPEGTEESGEGDESDVDQSSLLSGADPEGLLTELMEPEPTEPEPSEVVNALEFNAYVLAAVVLDPDSGSLAVEIVPEDADDTLASSIVDVLFTTPMDGAEALVARFQVDEFTGGEIDDSLITISRVVAEDFVVGLVEGDFGLTAAELAEIEQFIDDTFANVATNADVAHDDATGLTWGRWTGGNVLVVDFESFDDSADIDLVELTGNQSDHWIYGPRPDVLPTQGVAEYSFIGGTPSTTASGDSIGQGITAGTITADFGSLFVQTDLTVNHGGAIDVMTSGPMFSNRAGFATSGDGFSDSAGPCNPSCGAYVNGVFTDASGGAAPDGVGASFKLQPADAPDDYITGVGGFKQDSFDPEPPL